MGQRPETVFAAIRAHAALLKRLSARGTIRVLIADDDASVCAFIARVFRDAGYVTATAADGPEALRVAELSTTFDLLVTDVRMPDMTGPELVRWIRRDYTDLKVLYLTGYSDQLFKEKITLWEDEAFLDKPFTVQGLLEAGSLLLFGHLLPTESPT